MASDRVVVYTADVEKLAESFAAASGQQYVQALYAILEDATFQIQMLAMQYAPVDTGALRDSIIREVEFNNKTAKGAVIATAPYALYQEFGTGTRGEFPGQSYTIRPRPPNEYLAFEGTDGNMVYVKEVEHPGIPPRPFMRPAAERYFGPIMDQMADAAVITIIDTPTGGANYQLQTMTPDSEAVIEDIQMQGAPT